MQYSTPHIVETILVQVIISYEVKSVSYPPELTLFSASLFWGTSRESRLITTTATRYL